MWEYGWRLIDKYVKKYMERLIYKELIKWKPNPKRKPLILNAARQVGKTYILREFASKEYPKVVYFSLDREDSVRELFGHVAKPSDLILSLSAMSGIDIVPGSRWYERDHRHGEEDAEAAPRHHQIRSQSGGDPHCTIVMLKTLKYSL